MPKLHQMLVSICLVAACTTGHAAEAGYGVNPGDVLRVFVWNEEELTSELLVAPDGSISFPMVGVLQVRGQSVGQIADHVADGLSEYMRDRPVVTVSLLAAEGNTVFVHGAVARPGVYIAKGPTSIVQALAMAGGLGPFADESDIRVVRRTVDGKQDVFRFNYGQFKRGKALASNIELQTGDVVVVP